MLLVFAESAHSLWRGKEDEVLKRFEGKEGEKKKRILKKLRIDSEYNSALRYFT